MNDFLFVRFGTGPKPGRQHNPYGNLIGKAREK
jgi:hypothetical protein